MEKALSSLKKYKVQCILGPLFKIIEVVFELITPFIMRYIINDVIDEVIASGNYIDVILPVLIIILFAVVGFASASICQYFASIATWGVGEDVRNRLFNKIFSFDNNQIGKLGKSNLMTVVNNDVMKLQDGVSMAIRLALRAPTLVIGALIASFILSWQIALIYVCLIPLMCIVYFVVLRLSSRSVLKVQEKTDKITQISEDALTGIRIIKGSNKENKMIDSFEKATEEYFEESKIHIFLNAIINPFTFLIINLSIMLIVYFSTNFIFSDNNLTFISTGDLVALISYLNQILLALVVVCNLIVIFTKANASNKRINNILNTKGKKNIDGEYVNKDIKEGDVLFNFKDVSFRYGDSNVDTIHDINLKVYKGQSVGIIGLTGSGKSTLIKLFYRMLDSTKGELEYKGKAIDLYNLKELREEIGLVPQKNVLFKGTIMTNLQVGKKDLTKEEAIEALKFSDAYEFVNNYENFLDHEVEEGGKNFSGGQKQRLCIARAICKKPEVLIFDDSTSALDTITGKDIKNHIHEMKGITSVIISQKVSSVLDVDVIYVLENGTIIDSGTSEELLKRCATYKELYETQMKELEYDK